MIQLHITLKRTKDQSSHFCDCLVLKLIFQYHDRGLTKFHVGSSAQRLMCVVINNSSYQTFKNNNTAYHAFGKY